MPQTVKSRPELHTLKTSRLGGGKEETRGQEEGRKDMNTVGLRGGKKKKTNKHKPQLNLDLKYNLT